MVKKLWKSQMPGGIPVKELACQVTVYMRTRTGTDPVPSQVIKWLSTGFRLLRDDVDRGKCKLKSFWSSQWRRMSLKDGF